MNFLGHYLCGRQNIAQYLQIFFANLAYQHFQLYKTITITLKTNGRSSFSVIVIVGGETVL